MNRALAERPVADIDKREAILAAALRLIARSGLHNTPMSAIARESGVAAGTIYIYFESKDELINELYLEVVRDRLKATPRSFDPELSPREHLWRAWSSIASWHLDHRDASNFLQQCEASAILTEGTRARYGKLTAERLKNFTEDIRAGRFRPMPVHVFRALFNGPIHVLAHFRDKHDIKIDDEVLKATFEGVYRSVAGPAG